MKKTKKNSKTGLYNIKIGNRVFKSKRLKKCEVSVTDIEQILVTDLPLDITLLTKVKANPGIDLSLNRLDNGKIEVRISEMASTRYWNKDFSLVKHYSFKGALVSKKLSIRPSASISLGYDVEIIFEFSIRLNVITLGEAVKEALKVNKSLDDELENASKKRYIL